MLPTRNDLYHGIFLRHSAGNGVVRLSRQPTAPAAVPDPQTGQLLKIATIETTGCAICPMCAHRGAGGFVSFVSDLRLAYACPQCCELVWVMGS